MDNVSRILWAHGEVKCQTCGLPLDPAENGRDRAEYVQRAREPRAERVLGTHSRCGSSFYFILVDLPREVV